MSNERRRFLLQGVNSVALTLAFSVSGGTLMLTPAEARAREMALGRFSSTEGRMLSALAEGIVPGAAEAGVAHFIDHQLGVDPDDSLLIAKYFPVPHPYLDFYRRGLEAVDALARRITGRLLLELDAAAIEPVIAALARPAAGSGETNLWLFYLCLRSDAVDVVYGTPRGFDHLGVPYMPHIMPPEGWNG